MTLSGKRFAEVYGVRSYISESEDKPVIVPVARLTSFFFPSFPKTSEAMASNDG